MKKMLSVNPLTTPARQTIALLTGSAAISLALITTVVAGQNGESARADNRDNDRRQAGSSARQHGESKRDRNRRRSKQVPWSFGDPIIGLDAESLAAFEEGAAEFVSVEDIEGGLGPIFNDTSCGACHTAGAIGGASDEKVTRFGRLIDGVFDGYESAGGSLLQAMAIDPGVAEVVPDDATVIAQRVATPLFGAGLIDAIDDETIRTNAERRQPEGVTGRVAIVVDVVSGEERVGRFGWKAQHATLLAFSGAAYRDEMGVTNRFFPEESAPNGNTALVARFDQVPELEDELDPETGLGDVDHLANFMRFLAPPPALKMSADAIAGGNLFEQVECSACHTPVMFTGASDVAALANQPVRLFSDLLLHDMGELADGIAQAGADTNEMRTAPLWGLRARTSFLHDGRASTVIEAINQHAGEAARSQQLFSELSEGEQQQLVEYLNSN